MEPILLPANQPLGRFYRGGQRISAFRGDSPSAPNTPEDWVASTTSVRNNSPVGMTRLGHGQLLADAIHEAPLSWLGPSHYDRYGDDSMLLVKLLDAGQRLPVHAHPDREFANRYLSAVHGKAEAWYILSPGVVHIGLTRDVTLNELRQMVQAQDSTSMLQLMHEVPVATGDSIFVPHGVLHAIGGGVLLAEVQEPEDLSILLEWRDFDLDGERDGHLGLGFDVALGAVEMRGRSVSEVESLIRRDINDGTVLPAEADQFFRLDRLNGRRDFPAGFSVVVVLADARLSIASGLTLQLLAGSTTVVPYATGTFRIEGSALIARPPQP